MTRLWFIFAFIIIITFLKCHVYCNRFGYSDSEQKLWRKRHVHCKGNHQSPIAINARRAISVNMPAIEMISYHNLLPPPLKIHNNGHSITLEITKPMSINGSLGYFPYIFGGKLNGEYELLGLHFHWGDKNNRGAEHVLNDIRYPLEMHIVHKNRKYESVQEAMNHKDGLAVLAFFYQLKDRTGTEIAMIARHLPIVSGVEGIQILNYTFSLASLIGDINTERFYTYRGSLTTPNCAEAVTWVIFPDTLTISLSQIDKFRQLSNGIDGLLLVDNFRNLQSIGNRKIFVRSIGSRYTKLANLRTMSNGEDDTDWYYN